MARNSEYDKEFQKRKYSVTAIILNINNDKAIIDKLNSVNDKLDYVRQLIQKDIEKNKQNWNLSLQFLKVYRIDSDSQEEKHRITCDAFSYRISAMPLVRSDAFFIKLFSFKYSMPFKVIVGFTSLTNG